jgi:hypothetical protein
MVAKEILSVPNHHAMVPIYTRWGFLTIDEHYHETCFEKEAYPVPDLSIVQKKTIKIVLMTFSKVVAPSTRFETSTWNTTIVMKK